MIPSLSLSSSSSTSTTIRVDKATSELLVGPDWTMNMEICDLCNSNHWMAKDLVKGVKRRLKHKNPRVQLLTLTLLETMVKNCGEYIHYQIAERKILDELVKIFKKKGDTHVRDKILTLLDSWQEAFGGPGGKYSQYFWACDELRRCGAKFPQRSPRSAPVITPPVTKVPQIGYGVTSDSSRRLNEALTTDVEGLSASTLESMRSTLELLNDMLKAVNYADRTAVKDEVITDLVDRCRANQKKLMQMITTTTDEVLLAQGLEMNDSLQSVHAKHDALASGNPLPDLGKRVSTPQSESVELNTEPSEAGDKHPTPNGKSRVSHASVTKDPTEEEEEETEDDFSLLSRRNGKTQSGPSQQSGASCITEDGPSSSGSSNALALIDIAAPATTTTTTTNVSKEQDLIDLLSLVLTTSPSETAETPISAPVPNTFESSFNSYVVPWAQSQSQPQPQPQQMASHLQSQYQPMQPQMQPQTLHGYSQYPSSTYPQPPWDVTSGYGNNQHLGSNPYMYSNYHASMNNGFAPISGAWSSQNVNDFQYRQYGNQQMYSNTQFSPNFSPTQTNGSLQHSNSFQNPSSVTGTLYSATKATTNDAFSIPMQGAQSPLQHTNSFPSKASNPSALNGTTPMTNGSGGIPSGNTPFIPSYRLFEDLNVLGSSEGKLKSGPYPQNMVAGPR
ncbi:hypothetical protein RND81_01G026400 [Saponaria officinalis]|uniref:Uncharacterized protein n=1 Tax=Saponaria officinalis TaxID=3572 RepID=A0AAW1NB33_SAPOF